jgi:hypothetical protein
VAPESTKPWVVLNAHLPLAASQGNVNEAADVQLPLAGTALGELLLLLGFDLYRGKLVSHLVSCLS